MRFEPDVTALQQLLTGPAGPVVTYVGDVSRQGSNLGKVECPVDTGNLRARHEFAVTVDGQEVVGRFGSTADYAAAVHNGHKIKTSASYRGKRVSVSGFVKGNPWLLRAAARLGLTVKQEGTSG